MYRILLYILLVMLISLSAFSQPQFELSGNVYRIPYASGTNVFVSHDHFSHDPQGRYDLVGVDNGSSCSSNYMIVAAAEGIVRRVVDSHTTHGPDCNSNCTDNNNYVWIEHANGEWSKYTHMKYHSASVDAGLSVGDQVCAGTFLGYECDIGQASGPHLHFEVRHPNDPANVQISVSGGFMDDADHRIPVFSSFSKHYFQDDDEWTASSSSSCTNTDITLLAGFTIGNNSTKIYMASNNIFTIAGTAISFDNGSDGLFHAGNSITLSPGFTATAGTYFEARLGACGTTNYPGGCN